METKNALLTKEDVLSFNLWANYFNFLASLKDILEKELAAKLNGEEIRSFIESEFYNEDGSLKEKSSKDYPDSESVHFEVENKKSSIGFTFYYADTSKVCFDFYAMADEDGEDCKELRFYYSRKTDQLFSSEVIDAAVSWIQTGELNDFAASVVEIC